MFHPPFTCPAGLPTSSRPFGKDIEKNITRFFLFINVREPVVFANYIMWNVINKFVKVMPTLYRDAYYEFMVTITGNRATYRWEECIDHMQAVFRMPLGLLFVDVAFDEGSKITVRKLIITPLVASSLSLTLPSTGVLIFKISFHLI